MHLINLRTSFSVRCCWIEDSNICWRGFAPQPYHITYR